MVNIGTNAFFINLGEDGVEVPINDLANMASGFNYVVIRNIYYDAIKDINTFIKKILSMTSKLKVEIDTDVKFLPPNAGSYERVVYNAYINDNIIYDKKIIKWIKDASGNFIFTINKEEDIDGVNTFARRYEIDKSKVYLLLKDVTEDLLYLIRLTGYNVTFNVDGILSNNLDVQQLEANI
jgi:hypothetical protein